MSAQVFNKQNVFAKGPTKLEDAMMYATTPHMFSASPCALSRAWWIKAGVMKPDGSTTCGRW